MDGELGVQSDLTRQIAQDARADAVESPRLCQRFGGMGGAHDALGDAGHRRVRSDAARREKVISRMRRGSAPFFSRRATRCAKVLVLPDPAPAMIKSGSLPNSTARR